jgi:hypothetical protein
VRRFVVGLAVLALAIVGVPAFASGTTTFTLDCTQTTGRTISSPGKYRVSSATNQCGSTDLIDIDASNVDLDLGGNMLDANSSNCQEGVAVIATTATGVKIHNGSIRGCSHGLDGVTYSAKAITIINAGSDAIVADHDSHINRCKTLDSSGLGVQLLGFNNVVKSSEVVGNAAGGIAWAGGAGGAAETITKNYIADNQSDGILGANTANVISRNTIVNNAGNGIYGGSATISKNVINGNGGDGIAPDNTSTISGNTIEGNGMHGIESVASLRITGNKIVANRSTGITAGTMTTAKKNIVRDNHDAGIVLGHAATVVKNIVTGNGRQGIDVNNESTVVSNIVKSNGLSGIVVNAAPFTELSDSTIDKNISNGNGDDGMHIPDPIDGPDVRIAHNTTNSNAGHGIELTSGASGIPTGAGTNHAKDNGLSPQCEGFLCG